MPEIQPVNKTNELLIRLDERIQAIQRDVNELHEEINDLKRQIKADKAEDKINLKNYVTKDEFIPIQRSIYAVASLIIMTVIGTLVSLVVHK